MKIIYHIFDANRDHLVVSISESVMSKFPVGHHLIFIGNEMEKWRIYNNLSQKNGFTEIDFFRTFSDLLSSKFLSKDSIILLHSGTYLFFCQLFIRGYKHVNWINWGSGVRLNKSFNSFAIFLLKKYLYHKFDSIVTLIDSDKRNLDKSFNLHNTRVISYFSSSNNNPEFYRERILLSNKTNNKKKIIYLGNNSSSIKSYINLLDLLLPYKGLVTINCMLQYSLDENDPDYNKLLSKGRKLWDNDFRVIKKFYKLCDYPNFMNQCDIYICGVKRQTGLSAINTCLKLGKKVVLDGVNLEYSRGLGVTVFSCDEIKDNFDHFLEPLSLESKLDNLDLVLKSLDETKLVEKWTDYYESIRNL